MVTSGLAASKSCVGPSSFLSVSVARMSVILDLRPGPYIRHSVPPEGRVPLGAERDPLRPHGTRDLQGFGAPRRRLEPVYPPACGPHERRPGEQWMVLADLAVRSLVEVGVPAARDEGAEPP